MNRTWLSFLVPAVVLGGIVLSLIWRFPDAVADPRDRDRLIAAFVWALLPLSALLVHLRARPGSSIKAAGTWVVLGAAILAVYSVRFEVQDLGRRVLTELVPSMSVTGAGGGQVFRADQRGQFVVQATVDGVSVRFLVDTGATDVMLSMADAERLGYERDDLRFVRPYRTANGVVMGANVRLESVSIGDITLEDVAASVNPTPMAQSLLGMSFLGRLSSYEVTRNTLTLRR